jgi:hypothetical protein
MSSPDENITVPEQKIDAARALEVIKELIKDDAGREAYKADPLGAFDAKKAELPEERLRNANYDDIPSRSRRALEALSFYELRLLSDLDQTFVEDGLYVEVPSPGRLFYK